MLNIWMAFKNRSMDHKNELEACFFIKETRIHKKIKIIIIHIMYILSTKKALGYIVPNKNTAVCCIFGPKNRSKIIQKIQYIKGQIMSA